MCILISLVLYWSFKVNNHVNEQLFMYYIMFDMYLCWIYDRDFAALSQLMEQK